MFFVSLFDDSKRIEKNESEDVAHLMLAEDNVTADLVCGMLKDNGIHFMKKERSRGFATNIVLGVSLFGEDIYVERNRLDDAKELIAAYFSSAGEADEE